MRKKNILEIHVNDKYLVTDDIFTTKKKQYISGTSRNK